MDLRGRADPLLFELAGDVVLGRDKDENNPIDIDFGPFDADEFGISRQHAKLHARQDGLYISDLGSRNGTRVDGARCAMHESKWLLNGQQLSVASYRYHINYTHPANRPPPDAAEVSFGRSLLDKAGLNRRKDK